MALYVPGTDETDPKKIIMSQQLVAGQTSTNTTAIATANTNITTNTSDIATLNASRASSSTFGLAKVDGTTITATAGVISAAAVAASPIKASLGADTAISNSVYSDGPTVAQGTTGTWFASGTVTFLDTVGNGQMSCKLWDGTTVIASARTHFVNGNIAYTIGLSGFIASPAANIRMSCTSNAAGATSTFKFNTSGNSKDCTITAFRIA